MIKDEAKIYVKAGNGGNGAASFRREKYIPKGGPDGGDGADGGDVIFVASSHIHDLGQYSHKHHFLAENGENGMGRNMSGRKGEDLILPLPFGAQIYKGDELVADILKEGDSYVAAKGGSGGWGNQHFATSIKQAPKWAKEGLPGTDAELRLELKMIADVGLVGLPNAGKSTLLSVISNARPKIADYPFTTLEPNLGVVRMPERSFVVADIPGLIEGASAGRGLGVKFLKHIERTKIIVHLISADSQDILKDYEAIRAELELFSKKLAKKKEIVVVSKIELLDDIALAEIAKTFKKHKIPVMFISAVTHKGIEELQYKILTLLKTQK